MNVKPIYQMKIGILEIKQDHKIKRKNKKKKLFLKTYIIFLREEKYFLMALIAEYFQ